MFLWSKWDVLWESHDLNESKRERERERERERGGGGGAWHSICQQPTTKKVVGTYIKFKGLETGELKSWEGKNIDLLIPVS
jgi:hypothetical protein